MATTARQRAEVPIEWLAVAAFTVPTEAPESDGTLEWDSTTAVVVEVAGVHGLGYTYADATAAEIVQRRLVRCVAGRDVMDVPADPHLADASCRLSTILRQLEQSESVVAQPAASNRGQRAQRGSTP